MLIKKQRNPYLVKVREKLGMNLTEFSKYLGIDRTNYICYETLNRIPGNKSIEIITRKLEQKNIKIEKEKVFSKRMYDSYKKETRKNEILEKARRNLDMNVNQISKKLGIHPIYYSQIESFEVNPSKKIKKNISDYFLKRGVALYEEDLFPVELYNPGEKLEFCPLDEINPSKGFWTENDFHEVIETEHISKTLERALSILNEREAYVIINYHGLLGKEKQRLKKLSENMNKTPERVRQLKKEGIEKLKSRKKDFLKNLLLN